MEKILIFIAIVGFLNGASSLQCYRCTNCPTVNSDQLVTCGANNTQTTTPTPTNTTTTTTSTTTPSTTTQNTTSTNTTSTSSTTPSTTTTTSTTTPSTTTQNTTSTNTTTTSTTIPSTETQNTTSTNTTTSSTTPSTTTTTTTTSTTTPSTTTQNNTSPDSLSGINKSITPETLRVRRSIEDDCLCQNGVCDCNGLRIVQFSDLRASDTYVCVRDTVIVNGTEVINRGCAVKSNATAQTCANSSFSTNCNVCETDKCNDATSKSFSVLVILSSLLFALKLN